MNISLVLINVNSKAVSLFFKFYRYFMPAKAFGSQKAKPRDCFAENFVVLQLLFDAKCQVALSYRMTPCAKTRDDFLKAKAELQRASRRCANAYWTEFYSNIQECADVSNFSRVYSGIKCVNVFSVQFPERRPI